jgi:hypothetical protein
MKTILLLPLMISFGCGLAVNNSRAVLEALMGRKSNFIRTPKSGFRSIKTYAATKSWIFMMELMVGVWCLAGTAAYFLSESYLVGPFLLIYSIGFCYIGLLSFKHYKES